MPKVQSNSITYRPRALFLATAMLSSIAAPAGADALLASAYSSSTASFGPFNLVPGMESGVTAFSQGSQHILATKDGGLYAYGDNTFGQLGNGTNSDSSTYQLVPGMESGVASLAAGSGHNLVVRNGALLAWGWNMVGALGNGTSTNSNVPASVIGMSIGVTAVSAGSHFSMALQDGALYAWGAGGYGSLGNGSDLNSTVPVPVIGMESGVTHIASGNTHSLAIQNGALKAWGSNEAGQLGTGESSNYRNVPASVSGMESGVSAIAAGSQTSLAIKDGNVYAWGVVAPGFGNNVPLLFLDHETDFVDVTARRGSSSLVAAGAALSSDGSIWTWKQVGNSAMPPSQVLPPQGYKFTAIDGGFNLQTLATIAPRTQYGDANLDSTVNFDDLLVLAQNYDTATGATWTDGDFNLDNAVDFSDLLTLAQHYGFGTALMPTDASAEFQRDWAQAISMVPEPAAIAMLAGVAVTMMRRRSNERQSLPFVTRDP